MIKKEAVQDFLKEVEVDDLVKNIQIMGDSVFIDMVAHSPAMHEKKKTGGCNEAGFYKPLWREYSFKTEN